MSNPNEFVSHKGPSVDKSKYFSRAVVYTRRDDKVVLVDIHDATTSPALDPWPAKVYLLADGQHTVQELIEFASKQYQGQPPANLLLTLESVIGRLLESEIIKLTDEPVNLPYYLSMPADDQDPELSQRLMVEDNYMMDKKKTDS